MISVEMRPVPVPPPPPDVVLTLSADEASRLAVLTCYQDTISTAMHANTTQTDGIRAFLARLCNALNDAGVITAPVDYLIFSVAPKA